VVLAGIVSLIVPNDSHTMYAFQYGQSKVDEQITATQDAGSGAVGKRVTVTLNNLTPGASYHWRLAASNSAGIGYGPDSTFSLPLAVKPFVLPLKIGTSWKYLSWYGPGYNHGIHTWRVLSTDGNGTWTCMDTRVDTLGSVIPTRNDSLTFLIRDLPDYYVIEFPEFQALFEGSRLIPKWISTATDTVTYGGWRDIGTYGSEKTIFVSGIGLSSYYGKQPGMSGGSASLTLVQWWIPQ
jgi:hypothetical protein